MIIKKRDLKVCPNTGSKEKKEKVRLAAFKYLQNKASQYYSKLTN